MPAPTTDEFAGSPSVRRCAECDSRLAHDQRYCLDCGARRGALPVRVAGTIAAILEQGRSVRAPRGPAARGEPAVVPRSTSFAGWMPTPRAAAVGILSLLGFGAGVGSLVGSGVASPVSSPLVVVVSPSSTQPSTSGGGSAGGGSTAGRSSGSQGSQPTPAGPTSPPSTGSGNTGSGTGNTGGGTGNTGGGTGSSGLLSLPPIKHVFLIVLSDQGYSQTFGSTDKYFAKTLRHQGKLLQNYYAAASGELADGIALISGQGPTVQTAGDCPVFTNLSPATGGELGQVLGTGCVYPPRTQTLADELSARKHGGWKAYVEDLGKAPAGQPTTCRHPLVGGNDANQAPLATDPYVTWRNPFVYFHSLIDGASCGHSDVTLTQLRADLRTTRTTPALSYIVPSPCDDGNEQPCATGAISGLPAADKFLKTVVPEIEHSPAYKADGLIAITSDEAPQTGPFADPRACCDAQTFPNLPTTSTTGAGPPPPTTPTTPTTTPAGTTTTPTGTTTTPTGTTTPPTVPTTTPGGTTTTPTVPTTTPGGTTTTPTVPTPTPGGTTTTLTVPTPTPTTPTTPTATTPAGSGGQTTPTGGGGQVGLLLISRYVKPGTQDSIDYFNHFSLLASIEDIFGVKKLGYAADPALPVFDGGIFNAKR